MNAKSKHTLLYSYDEFSVGFLSEYEFGFCKLPMLNQKQVILVPHEGANECCLWKFHVVFMYTNYVQVVSLITAQVVLTKEFPSLNLRGIDYFKG